MLEGVVVCAIRARCTGRNRLLRAPKAEREDGREHGRRVPADAE